MDQKTLRILGFVFIVAGAVVAILNLKRVADLGMSGLTPVLLIVGLGLTVASKRSRTR